MKKTIRYMLGCLLLARGCCWSGPLKAQGGKPSGYKDTSAVTVPSTVSGATLYKMPVPNLTNTLYGRLQGLSVQQKSGEPGYDGATMYIRGIGSYGNAGPV